MKKLFFLFILPCMFAQNIPNEIKKDIDWSIYLIEYRHKKLQKAVKNCNKSDELEKKVKELSELLNYKIEKEKSYIKDQIEKNKFGAELKKSIWEYWDKRYKQINTNFQNALDRIRDDLRPKTEELPKRKKKSKEPKKTRKVEPKKREKAHSSPKPPVMTRKFSLGYYRDKELYQFEELFKKMEKKIKEQQIDYAIKRNEIYNEYEQARKIFFDRFIEKAKKRLIKKKTVTYHDFKWLHARIYFTLKWNILCNKLDRWHLETYKNQTQRRIEKELLKKVSNFLLETISNIRSIKEEVDDIERTASHKKPYISRASAYFILNTTIFLKNYLDTTYKDKCINKGIDGKIRLARTKNIQRMINDINNDFSQFILFTSKYNK